MSKLRLVVRLQVASCVLPFAFRSSPLSMGDGRWARGRRVPLIASASASEPEPKPAAFWRRMHKSLRAQARHDNSISISHRDGHVAYTYNPAQTSAAMEGGGGIYMGHGA